MLKILSPKELPMPFDKEPSKRSSHKMWMLRRPRFVLGLAVASVVLYLTSAAYVPLLDPYGNSGAVDKVSTPFSWTNRAEAVRSAFRSAYTAYEETAYPHDELKPLSGGYKDPLNGWGASLVDSIDTMLLMGHDDLAERALVHVAKLDLHKNQFVQFFETVIRYLGGMLSAYAMTDNPIYLAHADELGSHLLPIFNTTHGLTPFSVNMRTGDTRFGWMGPVSILSEFASCQMEYRFLAHLTGRAEYVKAVDQLTDFLEKNAEHEGLWALGYNIFQSEANSDRYSVGARADSAYEYLLKQWLMTGKTEPRFLDMYLRSADAIIENMLYISPTRQLLYVTDILRPSLEPVHDFQHLSCFLSGLFALGAATIPDVDERHAWAAEGLAHTCWITYVDQATGLGPEKIMFKQSHGKKWVDEVTAWKARGREGLVPPGVRSAVPATAGGDLEYTIADFRYLLRPETIESFYLMWRTTGDSKWRYRGWALFEAIEKHAKVNSAYASVTDVRKIPAPHVDDLPSFFFAETLKYAYLLFTDDDPIPLDKWVFNTEAHPLPVFTWTEWEQDLFGLRSSVQTNTTGEDPSRYQT